jgi:hypothetical protein
LLSENALKVSDLDFIKIMKFVSSKRFLLSVFVLSVVITNIQSILSGPNKFEDGEMRYCSYNNYVIFAKSSEHIREGKDLYVSYPDEYWDLYKYSPSFAVFFGFFAAFPDWLGLFLWNLLNTLVFFLAIISLPGLSEKQRLLTLALSFVEFFTSIQNEQSNALMAGLIILAFSSLEARKYLLAAFLIVFSIYIKLFGIVAIALYLFYPRKLRLTLYTLLWFVVLFLIPLVFVNISTYLTLLESYVRMLTHDSSVSNAYSVMGWLITWFGLHLDKLIVVLIGAVIFVIPLFNIRSYKSYAYRLLFLSSILIWVVVFNHKAESPTFVIAFAGTSIWFVSSRKSIENFILFVFAFVFTSLSPTDLFPNVLRENIVIPYSLKVFPMILIWLKIIIDGLTKVKKSYNLL